MVPNDMTNLIRAWNTYTEKHALQPCMHYCEKYRPKKRREYTLKHPESKERKRVDEIEAWKANFHCFHDPEISKTSRLDTRANQQDSEDDVVLTSRTKQKNRAPSVSREHEVTDLTSDTEGVPGPRPRLLFQDREASWSVSGRE